MPALLVDYENVSGSNGLRGADALCEKNTEILNLVFTRKSQGKKALYTGALHEFGRKDGTKIYQMIKDSMDSKH